MKGAKQIRAVLSRILESNYESVVRSAATNRNVMYLFVNVAKDDSETQCRFLSVLRRAC